MKTIITTLLFALAGSPALRAQDSLQTYIMVAAKNNREVMAQYSQYLAQEAGARGAGKLSDPDLTVMFPVKPMDDLNSKQLATFSVMQMFPWFGTLKAERKSMEYKAQAAYQAYRAKAIDLAFDMQRQWYAMLAVQDKIGHVEQQRKILADIKAADLYNYKSPAKGKGAKMSGQLRLEIEDRGLDEQVESLKAQLDWLKQQFNLTMHRTANSPVVLPRETVLRQMPAVDRDEIERRSPQLSMLLAQEKAYDAQADKARAMGRPMIGVGLEYMLNGKVRMPMMADMNGMDMVMPMVKVSLPIYRSKTKAAVKAANHLREAAIRQYEQQVDRLSIALLSIGQRADDELRKIKLYDDQLKLVDQTIQLMLTEYATGASTLTDILVTMRQQVALGLAKAEAVARYNTVVAEYDKAVSLNDYTERNIDNGK